MVSRDVHQVAQIQRSEGMQRLLRLLAGQVADILNVSRLSNNLGLDAATVRNYLSILMRIVVIRRVPAYASSSLTRATAAPKITFVDSGFAAHLAGSLARGSAAGCWRTSCSASSASPGRLVLRPVTQQAISSLIGEDPSDTATAVSPPTRWVPVVPESASVVVQPAYYRHAEDLAPMVCYSTGNGSFPHGLPGVPIPTRRRMRGSRRGRRLARLRWRPGSSPTHHGGVMWRRSSCAARQAPRPPPTF